MTLSTNEQQKIQDVIDQATQEERREMHYIAEAELLEVNYLSDKRIFSSQERKAIDYSIEILTRLEATKLGKGWWFRAKRRVQLVQTYIGS